MISVTACNATDFPMFDGVDEPIKIRQDNPVYNAVEKIGLHEQKDRKEIKEYTGVDPVRTEWCAAFVNAVLNESGIPGSESVSEYPLMARSFLTWGEKVRDPQPGDLIIFPRGDESWQGHVGFYLNTVYVNGVKKYYILGGNQKNKVSIEMYTASRALGIRRVIKEIDN